MCCTKHTKHQLLHIHGSYFFRLTNFPDFSSIFHTVFEYFLKFFFYSKYCTGWQISLYLFQFSSIIFSFFPVFWVQFPDFSSLSKIPWLFPDWKMLSHFSRFYSPSGNHADILCALFPDEQIWLMIGIRTSVFINRLTFVFTPIVILPFPHMLQV